MTVIEMRTMETICRTMPRIVEALEALSKWKTVHPPIGIGEHVKWEVCMSDDVAKAVDHRTNGMTVTYSGFPTTELAEQFINTQKGE